MSVDGSLALVLEDTELGRWALSRALEAEGFKVQAVATWAEASASLLRTHFSLAFVAVSSVFENVAEIVGDICRDHPDTHLILLADQDSVSELRPLFGQQADILAKPFDLQAVTQVALARARPAGEPGKS
jgi:DNA-binding NtrC family response regulator